MLPDYDNVILGFDNRPRMLSAAAFKGLWRANGLRPAFTIDGFVHGSWKLKFTAAEARLGFTYFRPLHHKDRAELTREGKALIEALLPGRKAEIDFAGLDAGP